MQYRSLLPMYYRKAAAAIIVYDITREETFDAVQRWITELHDLSSQKIILAIAGNKCDLEDKRKVPGDSHCSTCRDVRLCNDISGLFCVGNVWEMFAHHSFSGTYDCHL